MPRFSTREGDPQRLRRIATDFWFAVQRMGRRNDGPPPALPEPPPDDGSDGPPTPAGVPRRPAPAAGSASAALSVAREIRPEEDRPSKRIVEQRIRNNVIDYLDMAGSFERQREYEKNVPIAWVPGEIIDQWQDWIRRTSGADRVLDGVFR